MVITPSTPAFAGIDGLSPQAARLSDASAMRMMRHITL